MKMHGTLVSGRLDLSQYRAVSLRDTSNLHMLCNRRLSDITNNRTRRLSDVTPGMMMLIIMIIMMASNCIVILRSDPGLGRVPDPVSW